MEEEKVVAELNEKQKLLDADENIAESKKDSTDTETERLRKAKEKLKSDPNYFYHGLLEKYLDECMKLGSSDLHIKTDLQPCARLSKGLVPIADEKLSSNIVLLIIYSVLSEEQKYKFNAEKELDFSFNLHKQRYRANAYTDSNGFSLSVRRYNASIESFENLGIPLILRDMSLRKNGLILLTGPTGSGKSTTLAAIINYLNENVSEHIITLEDPIEFIHESKKCIITQREVGRDTISFAKGLRSCLRQDPDVIMLGEMRDIDSIATALTAAETGHLVLATLHTTGAENAIDRIIDSFPAGQQDQIRTQLSMVLLCVVSQQLIPRAKGDGRVLATEVLIANSAVKSIIRSNKNFQLPNTMQTSKNIGMYTLNQCLDDLYKKGEISNESLQLFQNNVTSINKSSY